MATRLSHAKESPVEEQLINSTKFLLMQDLKHGLAKKVLFGQPHVYIQVDAPGKSGILKQLL